MPIWDVLRNPPGNVLYQDKVDFIKLLKRKGDYLRCKIQHRGCFQLESTFVFNQQKPKQEQI